MVGVSLVLGQSRHCWQSNLSLFEQTS